VENIENIQVAEESKRKVLKSRDWCRKVLVSVLIAAAAGVIMFVVYLLINGRVTIEGVTTITIVTIFGLIFSMSLLDRLGI
jgi:hypothetical protein